MVLLRKTKNGEVVLYRRVMTKEEKQIAFAKSFNMIIRTYLEDRYYFYRRSGAVDVYIRIC